MDRFEREEMRINDMIVAYNAAFDTVGTKIADQYLVDEMGIFKMIGAYLPKPESLYDMCATGNLFWVKFYFSRHSDMDDVLFTLEWAVSENQYDIVEFLFERFQLERELSQNDKDNLIVDCCRHHDMRILDFLYSKSIKITSIEAISEYLSDCHQSNLIKIISIMFKYGIDLWEFHQLLHILIVSDKIYVLNYINMAINLDEYFNGNEITIAKKNDEDDGDAYYYEGEMFRLSRILKCESIRLGLYKLYRHLNQVYE